MCSFGVTPLAHQGDPAAWADGLDALLELAPVERGTSGGVVQARRPRRARPRLVEGVVPEHVVLVVHGSRDRTHRLAVLIYAALAMTLIVGLLFNMLPHRYEWALLLLGAPMILLTFGLVVWRRGFTREDRALFRRHAPEKPTLPPPGATCVWPANCRPGCAPPYWRTG